jgi:hypothetical protein
MLLRRACTIFRIFSWRPTKRKRGEFPRPLELLLVEVVLKIKDLLELQGILFHYF